MIGRGEAPPLVIGATTLEVRRIGPWLAEVLAPLGDDAATALLGPIELAVHELAMNSVTHGGTDGEPIRLEAELRPPTLTVRMWDEGREFNPSLVVPPVDGQPQIHGYGLMIVEAVASHLHYSRHEDRNVWTVQFEVDAGPAVDTKGRTG